MEENAEREAEILRLRARIIELCGGAKPVMLPNQPMHKPEDLIMPMPRYRPLWGIDGQRWVYPLPGHPLKWWCRHEFHLCFGAACPWFVCAGLITGPGWCGHPDE